MSKTFENLITLTQVSDGAPGAPGSQIRIEFSHEEILRYVEKNGVVFTPSNLEISVYESGVPLSLVSVTDADGNTIYKFNEYIFKLYFNSDEILENILSDRYLI